MFITEVALQRLRDDLEAVVVRIGRECATLHRRIDELERRLDEREDHR